MSDLMPPSLTVSELFYSTQGEGTHVGMPSVFLRLAFCHVGCLYCDTTEVWKTGVKRSFEHTVTAINNLAPEVKDRLSEGGCALVVTGGSPVVQHKALLLFLKHLLQTYSQRLALHLECEYSPAWHGHDELMALFNHISYSPKLDNCGVARSKFYSEKRPPICAHQTRCFKFVVADRADVEEVVCKYVGPWGLDLREVMLMPKASTRAEYHSVSPHVAQLSLEFGFRFSPRLQLEIWDLATGV